MRFNDINVSKDKIRKEIISRLRDQPPRLREDRSLVVQNKLIARPEFDSARVVMSYLALPTEVETSLINGTALGMGKRVVVPFIDEKSDIMVAVVLRTIDNLVDGLYGIRVPSGVPEKVAMEEIDLIVVPALAYDKKNMRLGRGKGYYDRFLSQKDLSSAKTIGIAFSSQLVEELPSGPNDRPVSLVLTD
jgi:5-formyltetrahydrofolate cyclo-ligase